jgi:hypothetical protein
MSGHGRILNWPRSPAPSSHHSACSVKPSSIPAAEYEAVGSIVLPPEYRLLRPAPAQLRTFPSNTRHGGRTLADSHPLLPLLDLNRSPSHSCSTTALSRFFALSIDRLSKSSFDFSIGNPIYDEAPLIRTDFVSLLSSIPGQPTWIVGLPRRSRFPLVGGGTRGHCSRSFGCPDPDQGSPILLWDEVRRWDGSLARGPPFLLERDLFDCERSDCPSAEGEPANLARRCLSRPATVACSEESGGLIVGFEEGSVARWACERAVGCDEGSGTRAVNGDHAPVSLKSRRIRRDSDDHCRRDRVRSAHSRVVCGSWRFLGVGRGDRGSGIRDRGW